MYCQYILLWNSRIKFIDSSISKNTKTIPQEAILNLTGLEEANKDIKIFIFIEKGKNGNFILYYKKYHYNASTITNYLMTVIVK